MNLTPAQQETLRSQPQSTKLYLSIFQPQVIFQAQINSTGTFRGMREIPYDNVVTGSYTNIENGFTMFVGSTQGGSEAGRIRVRSATASQVVVSENSNVNWQDNQWLTIFRYVDLWPIYPRIIQDPADVENTIWYKDYDIPYTNQNSILGTYVNMGPHRAARRDIASGLTQIYYSSTGSYNLLGDTLNYNWTFEGGTPASSSAADPGWVTYNQSGNFVTKLVISGSSGGVDTAYRYVTIDPPEYRWQLKSLSGSRGEGSYTASIKVFDIIPLQEHAVVVLYKESTYGNTVSNLGGNYPNASDIFYVGYIDRDSISYDYEHSEVSFDALSMTGLMKEMAGFSVSVESKANPAYWYELLDMDGRRALYHYLRWHTTAMMISDFQFVGDDYKIQFFDSDRESMYDALNNYMRDTLVGNVVSDRQGKVWMEVEAMAYTNPTGTFIPNMDITKRDWMGQPIIEERLSPDIAFMEYGGVAYSGTVTGTFAALIGSAPGTTPEFHGTIENHQGLAILGQSQLNSMVGNIYANKNSPYPTIGLEMAVNASNLDIAPQEVLGLHIAQSDTVRNVKIDGLYIPDSMSWQYNSDLFTLLPRADFKQLVNGIVGETVIIPISPTDDSGGRSFGGGFNVPPIQIPPFPTLTNPGGGGGGGSSTTPLADYGRAVFRGGIGWSNATRNATVSAFSVPVIDGSDGVIDIDIIQGGLWVVLAYGSVYWGTFSSAQVSLALSVTDVTASLTLMTATDGNTASVSSDNRLAVSTSGVFSITGGSKIRARLDWNKITGAVDLNSVLGYGLSLVRISG